MGETPQKLQISKSHKQTSNEEALTHNINQIEKNIEGLEKNISDLEDRREVELGELAEEKNYGLFFYIGGALVLLNLIFNFSLIGLIITIVFGIMFFVYLSFFNKEKRAAEINAHIDKESNDLKENLAEREEEIEKIRNKS